jgi:predicted dienelactone hydrolase
MLENEAVTRLRPMAAIVVLVAAMGLHPLAADAADAADVPLPAPDGTFAIGTAVFVWTDEKRTDPVTEDPSDKRRLVVQLWYPAEPSVTPGARPAPYVPELSVVRPLLARELGDAQDLLEHTRTNSIDRAPVSGRVKKYPVVVFSHGMGVPRSYYTMLFEDLASHGFVVAAIDHPHLGFVAVDGKAIPPYPRWTAPPEGGLRDATDEVRDAWWKPGDTYFSDDQRFVLDRLYSLARRDPEGRFTGRLDLRRVAMAGHSHGFLSATCGRDARFAACISLEGVPAMAERRSGFRQPFLAIRDDDASPRETPIYEHVRNVAYDVMIPGAGHNAFLDFPIQAALKLGYKLPAERSREIIRAYLFAFLDQHLNGKKRSLLAEEPSPFGEVRFTVYRPRTGVSNR